MRRNFILKISIGVLLFCGLSFSVIGQQAASPLYTGSQPAGNGLSEKDGWQTDVRIRTVNADYILCPATADPADPEKLSQAVIICPGGGYGHLAFGHEGLLTASWLNSRGVTAIILRYRVPNGHYNIPLDDLHQMIRTVRCNALEWGIDSTNVGVMGFSAGGHLAAMGATRFDNRTRPDFAVLIYPVVTMKDQFTSKGTKKALLGVEYDNQELVDRFSPELHVTQRCPPTLLVHCNDDTAVSSRNATLFYDALRASGVSAELHVFPTGGHGWGWKPDAFRYRDELERSLERWLKER